MTRLHAKMQEKGQFIEFRITSKNDGQNSNDLSAQAPTGGRRRTTKRLRITKKTNSALFFIRPLRS
jgi:uncharacterized protein Veg